MEEMEKALAAIKNPDLALAMRIFAMQMDIQHQANARRLEKIEDKLTNAFPGGDADGHRRAHEVLIESAQEWKALRVAIVHKSVPALFWALVLLIGGALLQYGLKFIAEHIK